MPVKGGLFVQFILVIDNDEIDYQVLSKKGYGILLEELRALGLEIEGEQEVKS
jgi:hypothetical protein